MRGRAAMLPVITSKDWQVREALLGAWTGGGGLGRTWDQCVAHREGGAAT